MVVTKKVHILGHSSAQLLWPSYGSQEGRKRKKNLPNLGSGAPLYRCQDGPHRDHFTDCDSNNVVTYILRNKYIH